MQLYELFTRAADEDERSVYLVSEGLLKNLIQKQLPHANVPGGGESYGYGFKSKMGLGFVSI